MLSVKVLIFFILLLCNKVIEVTPTKLYLAKNRSQQSYLIETEGDRKLIRSRYKLLLVEELLFCFSQIIIQLVQTYACKLIIDYP